MRGLKILAITLAASGLLLAPNAKAAPLTSAEQQYVQALEAEGISALDGNDAELAGLGWEICTQISSGWTPSMVMGQILKNTDGRVNIEGARTAVNAATQYLCPQVA